MRGHGPIGHRFLMEGPAVSANLAVVSEIRAKLGESPSWDSHTNRLYWVDISGHRLHVWDPNTSRTHTLDAGQLISAAAPRQSGGAAVLLQHGFYAVDVSAGQWEPLSLLENRDPLLRFNDGKCDPAGRFWAGTMDVHARNGAGTLYCLDTDLKLHAVLDHITCSNGITWSPDYRTMYYIDSTTFKVVAYEFDLGTGHLSHPTDVIRVPENLGLPDGMTSDREGMLWIAQWGGGQVSRWNPRTGQLLEAIQIPVKHVTSCIFGGKDLDVLYITTAEDQDDNNPLAGALFRYHSSVQGMPTFPFKG